MARIGSSAFLVPRPKIERPGSSRSRARACSSFAAPMTPMRVEKKVTAHSPAKMIRGDRLVAAMMFGCRRNEPWVMLAAMEKMTTR